MSDRLEHVQLHLVDDVDTAHEMMRWLSTCKNIGFDVEATGLDRMRDKVRTVQIGDMQHGWTIPWERWGGVVEELVRRYEGEYTIHNLTYDWLIVLQSCGISLPRAKCHDTRIMAHVLDPSKSTGLKSLAARLVDRTAAYASRRLDDALSQRNGWTWATVPVNYEPYWTYGALDPVLTMHVDDILRPQVMADAPLAYELERAVSWVAIDMSLRGAHIDREFTALKFREFHEYCDRVADWCVENYGVKPGQNASVIRVLQQAGYQFSKQTEAGALSLDKEVLGGINHPLAQAVLSRRQTQKVANTYLKNFLELSDDEDLLHPNINPLGFKQEAGDDETFGVRTGRMSMSVPNLQNLSRRTEGPSAGNAVRDCITAREGNSLLLVDFDQIEARLIAHLTEDPGFIAAFAEGDFFTNIARSMFSDDTIVKKDPRRQPVKNSIYARAYGAGYEKFARTAGITDEEGMAFYARLDMLYPGWKQFTWKVDETARARLSAEGVAYVRSPMTRRRHTADEGKLYVLVNYLIQGTAAEVFKMKLIELAQAGLSEYMTLPVHDEIISDVPNDVFDDVKNTVLSVMNDENLFRVPLTASAARGTRWGQKSDL